MRCTATILVELVADALFVPVHAVHRRGRTTFVYQRDGRVFDEQPVELGRSSDRYVEIVNGLQAEDVVLLRDPPLGTLRSQIDDHVAG